MTQKDQTMYPAHELFIRIVNGGSFFNGMSYLYNKCLDSYKCGYVEDFPKKQLIQEYQSLLSRLAVAESMAEACALMQRENFYLKKQVKGFDRGSVKEACDAIEQALAAWNQANQQSKQGE